MYTQKLKLVELCITVNGWVREGEKETNEIKTANLIYPNSLTILMKENSFNLYNTLSRKILLVSPF